jgi:hypothetical protein
MKLAGFPREAKSDANEYYQQSLLMLKFSAEAVIRLAGSFVMNLEDGEKLSVVL